MDARYRDALHRKSPIPVRADYPRAKAVISTDQEQRNLAMKTVPWSK